VKSAQVFQVHPTDTLTSMTVGSRDSIIYTETKLQAGQSRVCILGHGPTQVSYSARTWVLSWDEGSGWSMMLTIHLHLALRLRMCGAIPLLLLYAFMAHTVKCHFHLHVVNKQ
jgi:hypothetical protein